VVWGGGSSEGAGGENRVGDHGGDFVPGGGEVGWLGVHELLLWRLELWGRWRGLLLGQGIHFQGLVGG